MTGGLDRNLDTEALEVNDRGEDDQGRKKVHDVGEVLSVERFSKSALLVRPCQEQMEERNDSALEFGSSACIDRGWGECLPDDGLTDVRCDEQGDTAAQTIPFLQKFV